MNPATGTITRLALDEVRKNIYSFFSSRLEVVCPFIYIKEMSVTFSSAGETSCSYWAETEQAQGKRYTQERAQRKSAAQGTTLPRHFL